MTEQPTSDRPHDEADGEENGCVQLLDHRVVAGEKGIGEIERKSRVRVEVVPFDEISNGSDEDGFQSPANVGEPELIDGYCNLTHAFFPRKNGVVALLPH